MNIKLTVGENTGQMRNPVRDPAQMRINVLFVTVRTVNIRLFEKKQHIKTILTGK